MDYSWEDYGIGKVGACIFLKKFCIRYLQNTLKEAFGKKIITLLDFRTLILWFRLFSKVIYSGYANYSYTMLLILLKHNSDNMLTDFKSSKAILIFHSTYAFIHLKILSNFYVQVAVLGTGDAKMNKADKTFTLVDFTFIGGADRK